MTDESTKAQLAVIAAAHELRDAQKIGGVPKETIHLLETNLDLALKCYDVIANKESQ